MDKTTTTRLHDICALLEKLKPLLQENVGKLRQELSQRDNSSVTSRILESISVG